MGMAKWGMLPKIFGKTSSYDTPWFSILCCFVVMLPVTLLNLGDIVQIENTLYSLSLILECSSMVALRIQEPALVRPFSIGLSTIPLAIYLCFPVGLGIFSMIMCDELTWLVTGIAIIVGIIAYIVITFSKKYNWWSYETELTISHTYKYQLISIDETSGLRQEEHVKTSPSPDPDAMDGDYGSMSQTVARKQA